MNGTSAPFRACCGQQHFGPVCPDGLVMCPICFRRNPTDRLHVLEVGDGMDVTGAPIYSDVCRTCHKRERAWGTTSDPASRVQAIEAAEDHADQVAFDAWRERGL